MNEKAIKELRGKFVRTALISFIFVMLFTAGLINLANIALSRRDAKKTLDLIVENNGFIGKVGEGEEVSPEFRFSTRYFAVLFDEDGNVAETVMSHIASVDEDAAVEHARRILEYSDSFGHYRNYYFEVAGTEDGGKIVAVLDYSEQLGMRDSIIRYSVIILGFGLILTSIIVWLFSRRIIRPEIENVKRQKQFITNASHELKTPLAVIRANTEVEEMLNGENEWTQSTMRQVDRLNGLIQNLVTIARAEEQADRTAMTEIDVSRAVRESVEPYRSLAENDQKELTADIEDNVKMTADDGQIRQLAALLIDNAFKYCDDNGKVRVTLSTLKKGKTVKLVVSNSYAEGATVDYQKFFERFYREDESHNVDKGGYGIGLSIAESICKSYRGSIEASWKDGIISFTCLLDSGISG